MTFRTALLGLVVIAVGAEAQDWTPATPGYVWDFPRDHWAHDGYKSEWWYFTGHLAVEPESEPRFGYQFTFFKVGLWPDSIPLRSTWATQDIIMGHLAVTDHASGEHIFSEVLYRTVPSLGDFSRFPESPIAWSQGPPGTDEDWVLDWNGDGFDFSASDSNRGISLQLTTAPSKPLVFQGPGGFSRKGLGETSASQYYSFTRLRASGLLAIRDSVWQVTGVSWMDKEFGSNQLTEEQVGWDWFSIQLNDGSEIMLFELRTADGNPSYRSATSIPQPDADGTVTPVYLRPTDWLLNSTEEWRSPHTGATYPVGWTLSIDGRVLEIEAISEDQENVSELVGDLYYWEGAARVLDQSGRPVGRAYVELTGYGQSISPAI